MNALPCPVGVVTFEYKGYVVDIEPHTAHILLDDEIVSQPALFTETELKKFIDDGFPHHRL